MCTPCCNGCSRGKQRSGPPGGRNHHLECFLVTGALIFVSLAVPWLAFLITLTLRVAFDQQPAAFSAILRLKILSGVPSNSFCRVFSGHGDLKPLRGVAFRGFSCERQFIVAGTRNSLKWGRFSKKPAVRATTCLALATGAFGAWEALSAVPTPMMFSARVTQRYLSVFETPRWFCPTRLIPWFLDVAYAKRPTYSSIDRSTSYECLRSFRRETSLVDSSPWNRFLRQKTFFLRDFLLVFAPWVCSRQEKGSERRGFKR